MAGILGGFLESWKKKRAEAQEKRKDLDEQYARITDNVARLKSKDPETRKSAAIEAQASLVRWWDHHYYYNLIPLISDRDPEVRKAALQSFREMMHEDYNRFSPPFVGLGSIENIPTELIVAHFSEGRRAWKESPYFPAHQMAVDSIRRLVGRERDGEVLAEAQQTLELGLRLIHGDKSLLKSFDMMEMRRGW
ncbi:HEAT repeat domain-containing protein [Methanofollis fontis]|uniref:HEAT repeat domain-containing protein n=1 Tax=Methanofollis fontis TaxID=2052832 RepID=A0A483CZL1_9EURY|nr:hypothetical protein [Methanofollis fontis]TAJ45559.1 hypothetical protein CUJ86_02205 [Methanofollis fontis]